LDRASHWNRVFETQPLNELSWYQPRPERSLATIVRLAPPPAQILDVGAGASELVDALLDAGYERPIAMDVSSAALEHARRRLGDRGARVSWIVADVTAGPELPTVDLWHDRAVLHFLGPEEQRAYATLAARIVRRGGHAVIATFAPDGPTRCSGIDVTRHDAASIGALLGPDFELLAEDRETHVTPGGAEQRFAWAMLRRR
jgi:ubiquinone/menaquinone biosynthesis C-methylase UbiE